MLYTLDPWWEVDLGQDTKIKEVRIFNRNSGTAGEIGRLSNAIVTLKDASDREVARYQFGSVAWAEFTLPFDMTYASGLENFPGQPNAVATRDWIYPGTTYRYSYSVNSGCFSSLTNLDLSERAMTSIDKSMDLLVGKYTSIGTVRRYAELVNNKSIPNASELLPGKCCLDTALNSEFLGYNVSIFWMLI